MKPDNIRLKHQTLTGRIKKLQGRLEQLRETCAHPETTSWNRSSTGHYDPSANSYWIDFTCSDCGKTWSEDQK